MTRVPIVLSALLALLAACSNGNGGSSSTTNGGNITGGTSSATGGAFSFVAADAADAGMQGLPIAMAVGPMDQVGVAYFRPTGNSLAPTGDAGGRVDYGVMYLEVRNGAVTRPPSQIAVVQCQDGLTLNFDAQGDPVVGFLGGGAYFYDGGYPADAGPDTTGSLYWLQSQPALAYGQTDGGWNLQVCMQDSTAMGAFTWIVNGSGGQDMSAMQLINEGNVVGLWPSLLFDGGTTIMAYRDVHFGQFPVQDWAASDIKLCQGTPMNWNSWSAPMTIDASGGHKAGGYGSHDQMIFGQSGALAVLCDSVPTGQGVVNQDGNNAWFVQQNLGPWTNTTSEWTLPINPFNPKNTEADILVNTQSGPQMAYNLTYGYSVVAVDTAPPMGAGAPALYYVSSPDGKIWSNRQTVFSLGSGGFYPSIADDPLNANPNIVYTICSANTGILPAPKTCDSPALVLDVVSGNPPDWADNKTTVTNQAAFTPKIAFLSSDKFVIAYRDLDTGAVYVAIQN